MEHNFEMVSYLWINLIPSDICKGPGQAGSQMQNAGAKALVWASEWRLIEDLLSWIKILNLHTYKINLVINYSHTLIFNLVRMQDKLH